MNQSMKTAMFIVAAAGRGHDRLGDPPGVEGPRGG